MDSIHGDFIQTPQCHLIGHDGCRGCSKSGYSKMSLKWLNYINPKLQTIMSIDGEYKIKNSKYKADGYDKETNTIYEFHGDIWHGNPECYNLDDINPIVKITYRELYEKTLKKKEFCISQGYNYIEMWENDWKKGIRLLKQIQKRRKYKK